MKKSMRLVLLLGIIFAVPALILLFRALGLTSAVSALVSILAPLLAGICIAFIANIPMSAIEALMLKITHAKRLFALRAIRGISIILSCATVIAAFSLVLTLVIPEAKSAIVQLINSIPEYMAILSSFFDKISELLHLAPSENELDWRAVSDTLRDLFIKYGRGILSATVDAAFGIASFIASAALALITSIYLLASKENIFAGTTRISLAFFSVERVKKAISFLKLVSSTFKNYIIGQVSEAVILGVLCFVGMTIFSFPYALMTASLVAVTALVPVFGALIGAAGGALMILTVSPIKALWFLLFILVLQQLENNLIYPRVVGKSVGLPSMWVLVSATAGGALLGVAGLLAGVPIASVIYSLCTNSNSAGGGTEPAKENTDIKQTSS